MRDFRHCMWLKTQQIKFWIWYKFGFSDIHNCKPDGFQIFTIFKNKPRLSQCATSFMNAPVTWLRSSCKYESVSANFRSKSSTLTAEPEVDVLVLFKKLLSHAALTFNKRSVPQAYYTLQKILNKFSGFRIFASFL